MDQIFAVQEAHADAVDHRHYEAGTANGKQASSDIKTSTIRSTLTREKIEKVGYDDRLHRDSRPSSDESGNNRDGNVNAVGVSNAPAKENK
ncbi:uncharacterized protein N7487_010594 [Penicillium crustosum]|uniref:uncharacterized protein n=1 Tax=Penicillium crustosum TaxID=36656 RepID=UPI00238D0A64|nr:uncharacterized protein N7487_010594 [Penicillium crustosum]KAJ5396291.1 hypothetical protein N7487_010594 [Penicillium crustosum]